MAVYIDKLRDWGWKLGPSCHLIADSNEELHAFAAKLGLRREWFQPKASGPHYDLTAKRRALAVAAGAVELDDRAFHAILKKWREGAMAAVKAAANEDEKRAVRSHLFR
jgi:hypothetical protein